MAITALAVSNTGLQAASRFLEVVSNNVANSNTIGYKTAQITFQDALYSAFAAGAATTGFTPPSANQLGFGTLVDDVVGLFTQGRLQPTGEPFDLAITGRGFLAVRLPNGTLGYTRAGNFDLNANRQLVSADGYVLADAITIPLDASSVSIAANGTVTAVTPNGIVTVGQIQLTAFQNPAGLVRIGDTVFAPGPNSGPAITGVPGTNGLGTLNQGFLEQSNVELTTELVNLILAQRAFAFNTRAIQVENATLQATLDLIA
ncbi:MAG: flagellar hook-basal body complex protein [Gemmataceae bacterium]|nr:flagellar hook-basal body complex protein [Gemmata sp.]MDW8197982.1 flagellar hook-basal body complex protein [Gemmataceae bacterium]